MADAPRGRIARWLAAVPTSAWIVVGAGAVLGISALFGGLDEADLSSKQPPVVAVDEPIVRDELTIAVHSAELSMVAPDYSFEPDEGMIYLLVEATVTNNYTTTAIGLDEALRLDGTEKPTTDRLARVVDGSSLPQANPGLPIGVVWVFQVPEDEVAPGDTVRVTVTAKSFTEDGDVTYGSYWSDPKPTAFVDVEVQG
ncbi:hypothetical protein [Antiquaquibacter soli]|uniref:DUF4352 domain-containing protein n=1 Tax=Antiquaquibacter soli TaxID=3064523 RepID=A0ABT9BLZ9_9MICO|nr:hypothetical protein [Protaetiibacter sp. WY-16]MDO7881634.1 hypothetical protein [Protaetiibacter sp. WY-16]